MQHECLCVLACDSHWQCFCFSRQRVQATLFGLEDKKRMPLPGMSSFISPDKPNFKITTVRDSAPFSGGTSWDILNNPFPSSPLPPGPSGPPVAHENRASVIMKTPDVSKPSVKSCWWPNPRWTRGEHYHRFESRTYELTGHTRTIPRGVNHILPNRKWHVSLNSGRF